MPADLKRITVRANGIDFAGLTAGPSDGPLVLCLHGFPDTPHSFRHLLPALADSGYRAVAPFMRGYAPTGPAPDESYQVGALGADALALQQELGGSQPAVLIGHDWGALAAYAAASHGPDRWAKVVAMAVAPPGIGGRRMMSYDQIKRSFYMYFFQLPFADTVVAANDYAFIAGLWRDWSPGYDATDDLAYVRDALPDGTHVSAALAYYRSRFGNQSGDPRYSEVQRAGGRLPPQPLLYLHGRNDGCMGVDLVANATVPDHVSLHVLADVGHFLHLEQPVILNRMILEFLAG